MVAKKGLIFLGIVLGCMPCLFGNDEKIVSNKTNYLPAIPQKVDARISGDIERPLLRPVVYKKKDGYLSKITESLPTAPENGIPQSGRMQAKIGTSIEISNRDSIKDVSVKEGSSTAQLYTMKNNNKSESGTKNTINQRLEMIIKNVSQLDVAECYYKLCEYENALQMYKLFSPNNTSSDQYIWAQYQVANCYRNMKKYDVALSEYQRFVNQFPESNLTDQAKWYVEDIGWWKAWSEKNTLANNQLLTASNNRVSK